MNLELDNANMCTSQAEAEVKILVENSDKTEIIQQLSMIKIDLSNSEAQLNKERTERYNLAKENKYFRRTISKLVRKTIKLLNTVAEKMGIFLHISFIVIRYLIFLRLPNNVMLVSY